MAYIGTYCQSTATWLSAHQSIGVPQPLKMVGTEEQKKKWLPRLAAGEISAFALTEPGVGSDPAAMKTRATPTEDGKYYLINGEKLWITNGPDADILIVMAQTPPVVIKGKERPQITAFVVDRKDPETAKGFEVACRCRFMGLHGISNGLLRFKDMKVPAGKHRREDRRRPQDRLDDAEHGPPDGSRPFRAPRNRRSSTRTSGATPAFSGACPSASTRPWLT